MRLTLFLNKFNTINRTCFNAQVTESTTPIINRVNVIVHNDRVFWADHIAIVTLNTSIVDL
nr:hypothetical protein [Halobacteriovorax sp. GB3]